MDDEELSIPNENGSPPRIRSETPVATSPVLMPLPFVDKTVNPIHPLMREMSTNSLDSEYSLHSNGNGETDKKVDLTSVIRVQAVGTTKSRKNSNPKITTKLVPILKINKKKTNKSMCDDSSTECRTATPNAM